MFFHFNWYLCDWFKAKKSKLNSFFLQKFIDTQHTFPQTANSNSTEDTQGRIGIPCSLIWLYNQPGCPLSALPLQNNTTFRFSHLFMVCLQISCFWYKDCYEKISTSLTSLGAPSIFIWQHKTSIWR